MRRQYLFSHEQHKRCNPSQRINASITVSGSTVQTPMPQASKE